MKHLVPGMAVVWFLAVFFAEAHAQTMKLTEVLVFDPLDVKADADPRAFAASPGWNVHLLQKDRGNRPGRYVVVLSSPRRTGAAPVVTGPGLLTESREYRLVGADRLGALPDVDVLGIHYLNVRPERREAFDRFVIDTLHPAVGNLRPDLRLLYYKAVSGGDAENYITIFALTRASRDKYWPKGSDSDALKAAFKPVQALTEELKTYLVDGSYATGNLAAAVYESRVWADWVLVPPPAR
jgi:hypothetical protein